MKKARMSQNKSFKSFIVAEIAKFNSQLKILIIIDNYFLLCQNHLQKKWLKEF